MRFEVVDTGPGISPEVLPRLFAAFEQADPSTARRFGGTGLGLAITSRLVRLMGGQVGADSRPGEGSRFWFTIPLERASSAGSPLYPPAAWTWRRALVVDDLPEARAALAEILVEMGGHSALTVSVASSGVELVEQVLAARDAGQPFDLLVVDWRMPGLDGIAALAQLRARGALGLATCLLVTAFDHPEPFVAAREAGYQGVLVKPVTPSALNDELMRITALTPQRGDEPPAEGAAEKRLRAAFAGSRVLLAEDNPVNQEVALELLREAGLAIDLAADGSEAVALARTHRYALILMDMQMPEMDGLEATRVIRRLPGNENIPIIAMTANAFAEDRAECLAAGMNDHVAKPVDPEDLYTTLWRWLSGEARI